MSALPPPSQVYIDSTPLLNNPKALQQRAEEAGYLFFKNLLPAQDVMKVRRDILEVVEAFGWRARGQTPEGGLLDPEQINEIPPEQLRSDIGVSIAAYDAVQKLESVHRLPHHPALLALYRELLGERVLVHPRHVIRMISCHRQMVPTPLHQDFPLIQGTRSTWTCWFPLGACPRSMGSLSVLPGSHHLGYLPIREAAGAGGLMAQLCPGEGDQWAAGDFAPGDVLTFNSLTLHRALPNEYRHEMRLSMDVRYQSADEEIEERSLRPHCNLSWEEIYADWHSTDLQYYWRKETLKSSLYDFTLVQPSIRIC